MRAQNKMIFFMKKETYFESQIVFIELHRINNKFYLLLFTVFVETAWLFLI